MKTQIIKVKDWKSQGFIVEESSLFRKLPYFGENFEIIKQFDVVRRIKDDRIFTRGFTYVCNEHLITISSLYHDMKTVGFYLGGELGHIHINELK
jgi:hypothetical protein